ncbi:MAG: hypothetical protein AAGH89_09480 [Verrucomicrobiota bacterium]
MNSIRQLIIVFLITFVSVAQADPVRLSPKRGEMLTFQRTYSHEHLAENPTQFVDRMIVQIFWDRNNLEPQLVISLWKVGDTDCYEGQSLAEPGPGGSVKLQLEGDGGTATIEPNEGYVLLKLRGDDYLGFEGQREFVSLSAKDPAHRTFKLYPVKKK